MYIPINVDVVKMSIPIGPVKMSINIVRMVSVVRDA